MTTVRMLGHDADSVVAYGTVRTRECAANDIVTALRIRSNCTVVSGRIGRSREGESIFVIKAQAFQQLIVSLTLLRQRLSQETFQSSPSLKTHIYFVQLIFAFRILALPNRDFLTFLGYGAPCELDTQLAEQSLDRSVL